jgi:D-alanyl-D-alanine carboxypeptidase
MPEWTGPLLWNGNYLLHIYEGARGVKTGYTEGANYTIVSSAERNGRELFVAVMGSWNLYTDSMRLLDWAFANTKSVCPTSG